MGMGHVSVMTSGAPSQNPAATPSPVTTLSCVRIQLSGQTKTAMITTVESFGAMGSVATEHSSTAFTLRIFTQSINQPD